MDVKKRFEALSPAFLEVTLPRASDFDAVALLRSGHPEEIARAPGRKNLFFDEEAKILITLRTSDTEEGLREILPNIELVITAHATDAVPQGNSNVASASGKHDLASQSYPGSNFLDIIPVGDHTYVVFEPVILLSRPSARLQRPAIYFTATIKLAANVSRTSRSHQKDYLKSFEPLPDNVLEPLNYDPALRDANIYLSETRVTKVIPKPAGLDDSIKAIRGASKRAFPAVPALFTRIRYSTLPDAIIASLHIETSNIIAGSVEIRSVEFSLAESPIQPLTEIALPLRTHSGDETVFLYRISSSNQNSRSKSLTITIQATAILKQGSTVPLRMTWDSTLDLADHASNSNRKTHTWSRPLAAASHHKSLSVQSIHRPSTRDTLSTTISNSTAATSSPSSATPVIFTFTAPSTPIVRGETFTLLVQCNNLSPRTRRFALVMLASNRKPAHHNPNNSTQIQPAKTDSISTLFSPPDLPRRPKNPERDFLDLNPDVRIGPLPAGACFETGLKFRALKAGVLDLGVLRIVDLEERRVVDVGELPEVIVLDGEGDSRSEEEEEVLVGGD